MSSGYGAFGGRGRCFALYADFEKCMQKAETPFDCTLQREDYFECLHHKKEFSRLNEIQRAREERDTRLAEEARHARIAEMKARAAAVQHQQQTPPQAVTSS